MHDTRHKFFLVTLACLALSIPCTMFRFHTHLVMMPMLRSLLLVVPSSMGTAHIHVESGQQEGYEHGVRGQAKSWSGRSLGANSRVSYRHFGHVVPPPLFQQTQPQDAPPEIQDVQERYIEQPLNHFPENNDSDIDNDNDKGATYEQRYFYSSRFVLPNDENEEQYAFLCVGGEGPALTPHVLVDSVHCTGDMLELAESIFKGNTKLPPSSVHLYALEHRYYGKSIPQTNQTLTSMANTSTTDYNPQAAQHHFQHLSSRQALADVAHFITTINTDVLSNETQLKPIKWITFGGSYPGMLSGWSRWLYPHLIHASVSHSAPVQNKLNFWEYNAIVAQDLADLSIGGSQACLDTYVEGHAQIVEKLENGGVAEMAELFEVCGGQEDLVFRRNVELLVGDGVVYVPAQANDPQCTDDLCNIEKLCQGLLEDDNEESEPLDAMHRLARIALRQRSSLFANRKDNTHECTHVNWNEYISSITIEPESHAWLWQTCTEFGFYQTCEENAGGAPCPYGQGYHPLEQDLQLCTELYNLTATSVATAVNETLAWSKGWHMDGTRIMYVNGDVDPWSFLAISVEHHYTTDEEDAKRERVIAWVKGASHHYWTHPSQEGDSWEVKEIRKKIHGQVVRWLQEEESLLGYEDWNQVQQ